MTFKQILEDEGGSGEVQSSITDSDIDKFGDRIGAKRKKSKTPMLKKPMVNWTQNRMEFEA